MPEISISVQEAAERLLAEVANHRFVMRRAHDPDMRFIDDIEIVANALAVSQAEVARLTIEWQAALERARVMRDDEIERLTEALEWYADPEHWVCPGDYCHLSRPGVNQCFSQGSEDRGDTARTALALAPEQEPERAPGGEDSPAHLRDDAPSWQCDTCGRRTWSTNEGPLCGIPQPNGRVCGGRIVR